MTFFLVKNYADEYLKALDKDFKDYILTLLFVKYVSDRFKSNDNWDIEVPEGGSFDDISALKYKKNIGEGINIIIGKLAEANDLKGIIDIADFNSDELGTDKEAVDKLSGLVEIFQKPELDFTNNRAGGDDILGDAYEFLMRKFAQDSGKSKGQFYTPGEVSRIMAKVIGIDKATDPSMTVYDPACGSGSLLIRAADEAPCEISIYGQEKDNSTAGLARMNLVLHNKGAGVIVGNKSTLSAPQYKDENNPELLKTLVDWDNITNIRTFMLENSRLLGNSFNDFLRTVCTGEPYDDEIIFLGEKSL